jgi:tripartite ATP-independent transporter DctP family solute receptor
MFRKYQKLAVLLGISTLIISLLSGCGGGGNQAGDEGNEQKVIEIKLAHGSPATNDRLEASSQEFKKIVEEKTNGKVKVTTFPANQIGSEREQMESVQMGTIQACIVTTGPVPGLFPEIQVLDLPFLFSSEEVAYEVLDGPVGTEIAEKFRQKTGINCLAWGENGFRHFTNNVRPVEKPEDLNGLKIRTMENPTHMAMMKALGAIPTPIPIGELYTALSQGVVDGQENPASIISSFKFNEVQDYMTLDGHLYSPYMFMMNEEFLNNLDEETQAIIKDAAIEWREIERDLNRKQVIDGIQQLKDLGMNVTELSLEQKQAFREATKTVYDGYKKEFGEEMLNKVLDAVAKAESK